MSKREFFTIADTSPVAAGTAAGTVLRGLSKYDWFNVDAALVGATGGTLDVYLQRGIGTPGVETWVDWCHFAQLAAGASAVKYSIQSGANTTIQTVGYGTSPALAVATFCGGHPGDAIRALYVAGSSTSAGAAVSIIVTAWMRST